MAAQSDNLEVMERNVADASASVKQFEGIERQREDRPDGTVDLARAVAEALGVAKLECRTRRGSTSRCCSRRSGWSSPTPRSCTRSSSACS